MKRSHIMSTRQPNKLLIMVLLIGSSFLMGCMPGVIDYYRPEADSPFSGSASLSFESSSSVVIPARYRARFFLSS